MDLGTFLSVNNDVLTGIASIVTIVSLAASPIVFFWQRWSNGRSEQNRASKNLQGELDDALNALDHAKYPGYFWTLTFDDGKEVQYMFRHLNHDVYDSLIFSGKINFLRHDLQQKIQDVFKRIKIHNDCITKIRDMISDDEPAAKIYPYYARLENIEKILLRDIPLAKEKLMPSN